MDDTIDLLQIKIEKAKEMLPAETVNAIAAADWKAAILGMRLKKGYTFEQLGDLELETELMLCGLVSPEDYPKELENRMGISGAEANELVNEMNDLVFKKIREELIRNTERKEIFRNKTAEEKEEKNDRQILNSAGIEIINGKETLPTPEKLELGIIEQPPENREEILKKIEKPEFIIKNGLTTKPKAHPILMQKLSNSFQIPMVKTEHALDNISKSSMSENSPPLLNKEGTEGRFLINSPHPDPLLVKERENKDVKTPVPQAPKIYPKNGDPYRINPE